MRDEEIIDERTYMPRMQDDFGSLMPEGTYRPVPIVWFVAAWLLHGFAMMVLLILLSSKHHAFTWATTALASILIIRWTFARGMKDAALGWRVTTVLALLLNWGLTALTAAALRL